MIFQFLYVCLYDEVKQNKGEKKTPTKFLCNKDGEDEKMATNCIKLEKSFSFFLVIFLTKTISK